MDRTLCRLIFASSLAVSVAYAQDNKLLVAPPPALQAAGSPKPPEPKKNDQFEDARRLFEKLSPEDRHRFADNLQRWQQMPPAERAALRDREQFRRERIAQEINRAIQKSGLQLDRDRREVYALRYAQERRKIEQQLRDQMEADRTTKLAAMLERLKTEFSAPASVAVAPSPAPSASPK